MKSFLKSGIVFFALVGMVFSLGCGGGGGESKSTTVDIPSASSTTPLANTVASSTVVVATDTYVATSTVVASSTVASITSIATQTASVSVVLPSDPTVTGSSAIVLPIPLPLLLKKLSYEQWFKNREAFHRERWLREHGAGNMGNPYEAWLREQWSVEQKMGGITSGTTTINVIGTFTIQH